MLPPFLPDVSKADTSHPYDSYRSTTGIVNLYTTDSLRQSSSESLKTLSPEPMKSLEHLTTPISGIAWHPSSELLCIASAEKKDSLRMVSSHIPLTPPFLPIARLYRQEWKLTFDLQYHLPSGTAYSNWPTQNTPIGRANCVAFSSGGQYFTVGNQRGQVLLYNAKHFGNPTGIDDSR